MTNFIVVSCISLFILVAHIMIEDSNKMIRYDCRMVDVSPDMPEQVKQMCRSRR